MKIEINNLTALIQGRDLTLYQRSLAVEEWHKLLNHVNEMEQALSLGDVSGSFTADDVERAYDDGYQTEGEVSFDIENYR